MEEPIYVPDSPKEEDLAISFGAPIAEEKEEGIGHVVEGVPIKRRRYS